LGDFHSSKSLSRHRFEENQPFPDRIGFFETTLALPNGTWELRVTAPNNGVVGSASRSLSGASTESYVEQTLASFGSCVPDEVSDLAACRGVRPIVALLMVNIFLVIVFSCSIRRISICSKMGSL
jgi:hypothetical protein